MPARKWQTVRVFISSTFRDMHAERDHLVKVVFPALRERLEKHRIHLVDIDLRWGITEEESRHDRVLDLCLQQIDECRPFFVGILGERYGWVPKTFHEEAASKYGWVQHHTGKSEAAFHSCAVAPDGDEFVAGDEGGHVHFLRLEGCDD
jgi:telomerase protein component 1